MATTRRGTDTRGTIVSGGYDGRLQNVSKTAGE